MSYQTSTVTRSNTITHTDVRNVIWKIKSDMFQLRLFHDMFDAEYEEDMSYDLFQWTYRGYADAIKFQFFNPATYLAHCEIKYDITRGQVTGSDDDAGSIPFLNLKGTSFRVVITPSASWNTLSPEDRQTFYDTLKRQWGSSNLQLQYTGGSWLQDKTYSSNSFGANRSIYKI